MTRSRGIAFVIVSILVLIAGCAEQQAQPPVDPAEVALAEQAATDQDRPVKLDAYINVASGCQDWTVDVINELDEQYDSIEAEIIDFGLPEGLERMEEEGISCMTLLFDGSPVVQIPDEQGGTRTVVFYFPVGFGWTHEDLTQAFAAIDSGEAKILDETEAQKALAPEQVAMEVTAEEAEEGANVLMNGQIALTITEEAGGRTPMQRAEAARAAIAEWTAEPVHPRQLKIIDGDDGWSIVGRDNELVHVYHADAEAAGVTPGKKFASQWFNGIRCGIVGAARSDQDGAGPDAGTTCATAN
ncbi:MAG: hypothetical protein ACOCX2_10965 [Armatimonadota bacterium]